MSVVTAPPEQAAPAEPRPPVRPARRGIGPSPARKAANYIVLAVLAALFVAPIVFMIVASLKPDEKVLTEAGGWRAFVPTDASFEYFGDVFERVNFERFMFNSLLITTCVVVAGLFVNSLAGYAFARMQWRGRNLIFTAVVALVIVPFEAIAVPLFNQMVAWGWRESYQVQIVPFIANAFSIFLFYTFFLQLPRQIEEAARIDGAGPWRTFFRIIVPSTKPAFATVAILTFLTTWGSFLWPVMVTSGETFRPLPLGIATFQTLPPLQWGDIMAFGVMMVAPILVVFLLFQRWFVASVASSGVKG